jgi:membrane protein
MRVASRPRMLGRDLWKIAKETAKDWSDDDAATLAAALAYYALLSLAPLMVISIGVAGWFLGPEAARGRVAGELGGIVGGEAAQGIQAVVASADEPKRGVIGAVVGIVTLFIGASGVFGQLQTSLNAIWEVKPKPGRGLLGQVKDRFFSFTMVLGVAFLLLVSLVLSSLLSSLGTLLADTLPGGATVWQLINFALSFGVITLLFALIFKVIPDAKVQWRDVWLGAAVTALLFVIGKQLLGLYLGKAAVGSSYGAAGSIVALVVWVYYAAQILFVGAEFTQVHARHRGAGIEPAENAQTVEDSSGEKHANRSHQSPDRNLRPAQPSRASAG